MRILNRTFRLLPSVLLTTAASLCISQVSAAAQAAPASHSIGGQVVNSVSGEPIARARVQVGTQQAVLTDHDGRFALDGVHEDSAYAFASKPGYFAEDRAVLAQGESIAVRLVPEAILFGTISDQNGQPVQDLRVQLSKREVHNGLRRWQEMQSTVTSAEGKFRFAELPAGQYSLATSFRIDGLAEAASSVAFAPFTFPPPAGEGIRGSLTLAPGDHVEANATAATEKLFTVSGVVHGSAPWSGGLAAATESGEPVDAPVIVSPGGAFRLRLPSGSYRLIAHSAVEREQQFAGTREIAVGGAPLEGISIVLAPPAMLLIDVEYQAVATGAQTAASTPPLYLNASLENEDPREPARTVPAQPRTLPGKVQALQPGDSMVFRDVEPGRYLLQALPTPPWYVASATCGNLDLTRDPLVIAADAATPCTVRMVYRDDSASLKWSVSAGEDNNSSNQVFVTAIPLDNFAQSPAPELSAEGKVAPETPAEGSFEGLAPGRYLVLALTHPQELAYRDNEALQGYLPLGQQVTLTRGGKSEVQLKLVTGEP